MEYIYKLKASYNQKMIYLYNKNFINGLFCLNSTIRSYLLMVKIFILNFYFNFKQYSIWCK